MSTLKLFTRGLLSSSLLLSECSVRCAFGSIIYAHNLSNRRTDNSIDENNCPRENSVNVDINDILQGNFNYLPISFTNNAWHVLLYQNRGCNTLLDLFYGQTEQGPIIGHRCQYFSFKLDVRQGEGSSCILLFYILIVDKKQMNSCFSQIEIANSIKNVTWLVFSSLPADRRYTSDASYEIIQRLRNKVKLTERNTSSNYTQTRINI